MSKSTLVAINAGEEEMSALARVVGYESGSWPMLYLGMPLGDTLVDWGD